MNRPRTAKPTLEFRLTGLELSIATLRSAWAQGAERRDEEVLDLKGRVSTLESMIERIDADRKLFAKHQTTLGNHVRRLLREKAQLMTVVESHNLPCLFK